MNRSSIAALSVTGVVLLCGAPLLAQQNAAAEKAAETSARSWIALTDTGKYPESWTTASDAFKKAVTKDKWVAMAKQARDPLGKMKSRKLKLSQYAKTPQGEFVSIQYNTEFAKKTGAVETVAEMHDKDGKWRTVGYFIK